MTKICVTKVTCFTFLTLISLACAADVSGDWEFAGTYLGETTYARVTLKAENDKLTGQLNELKLDGSIKGDELTLNAKRPNGDHFGDFKGKAVADKLEGTAVWSGDRKVSWTAQRAATPPASPRVHEFEPKEFHRVFSDSIPPVLHIFPRDTVRTWTVDAGGVDKNGKTLSQGGNPETGPFYVEGALPGDLLVVKLNRVRLNRDSAGSGNQIVPTALTPNYLQRNKFNEKFDSQ